MRTYFFLWWTVFPFFVSAQGSWQDLNDQGVEAFYAEDYKEAAQFFEKALQLAEDEFGMTHPNYVISASDLADTYRSLGLYSKAEALYLTAKKTIDTTTGEEHPYYATHRVGLAELYQLQGRYELAEALYLEAKKADEKSFGKESPDYAITCNNLAYLYNELGAFPEAEKLFLEAKKIREKALGKNHPDYAESCNNLASLYLLQGLYAKAEALFLEAKAINQKVLGKESPLYADDCNNLAALYFYQKKYPEAQLLYLEAKNIRSQTLGREHPLYAQSCNNLAMLFQKLNDDDKAESLLLEAKNIREQTLGKEHRLYALSCNNLAWIYTQKGLYSQAEPLYKEGKNILEKTLGASHPEFANACYYLANLYKLQRQYAKAEPLFLEAASNKINQIQSLLPTLSETERKAYLQSIEFFFKDFYAFAALYHTTKPSIASEVFNMQLLRKALLFQSTQKIQSQILSSKNDSLIAQYKEWKSKRAYLSKILQWSLKEKNQRGITPEIEKTLSTETNELERTLSQASTLFDKTIKNKTYTWRDAQQQLKKGEILIEIIRIGESDKEKKVKYMALIVTSDTENYPQTLILENGNDLEGKYLRNYRNTIKSKLIDKYSYEQYWLPILQNIPSSQTPRRVYVSPDGVYHQLNLLTLRNPENGKYIIDEIDIQLISSPKDLITFAQKSRKQKKNFRKFQIHLFGYPAYQGQIREDSLQKDEKKRFLNIAGNNIEMDTTLRFLNERGKISLLPGTKIEVEKIHKTAQSEQIATQLYLSHEANEENIKLLKNPDFLHIATHGFFLANLSEANEDERGFAGVTIKKYLENPLLRCGLLLAGAETSLSAKTKQNQESTLSPTTIESEDGILTAREALNLHLDNTQLVVLSACETGLGEISNGEGVYGLQRAFQQAGAKTVLISLWTVSDEATQKMMTYFYENLFIKKQDKREAFRNSQNKLKAEHPEPYYWGAFVMVGE